MTQHQQTKRLRHEVSKIFEMQYLLFCPKNYDAQAKKRWPMILFLHGAGERGTNIRKVLKHGPPKIVRRKADFPFVVVSPQCPARQTWCDDTLLAVLDEVTAQYKVDLRRIYLTGLSLGGYGTWSLGLNHPDRFAAIAPICGGGSILPILLAEPKTAKRWKALPVWAFHGAKDDVVELAESERMIDALREIGSDAKLTVYPNAAHNSWTETYENPALYAWFLQHKNPAVSESG